MQLAHISMKLCLFCISSSTARILSIHPAQSMELHTLLVNYADTQLIKHIPQLTCCFAKLCRDIHFQKVRALTHSQDLRLCTSSYQDYFCMAQSLVKSVPPGVCVLAQAGVNASSEQVLEWLVKADTASAFNISFGDVKVTGVQQVCQRLLM